MKEDFVSWFIALAFRDRRNPAKEKDWKCIEQQENKKRGEKAFSLSSLPHPNSRSLSHRHRKSILAMLCR